MAKLSSIFRTGGPGETKFFTDSTLLNLNKGLDNVDDGSNARSDGDNGNAAG